MEEKGKSYEGQYLLCGVLPPTVPPPALALAVLVALPLRVTAQAAPPFGMEFLQRPMASGTTFTDYDWTGLKIDLYTRITGYPNWYPYDSYVHEYGGNSPGAGYYWYQDFGYDYLDANGDSVNGGKVVVSGTSTYKWQWNVPDKLDDQGGDTGIPDLTNFPVPSLYMMARVQGRIEADLLYGGSDVSADGKLQNQWTSPANTLGFSGLVAAPKSFAATTPTSAGERGIVSTTLDPSDPTKTTLQGLVSPNPYLNGYGNTFNLDCSDTELQLEIHEHAFALELCYYKFGSNVLDPFGYAAKRGDGKNQYVFNAARNVFIPVGIKLNGAQGDVISDDTYWLIHTNKIQVKDDLSYTTPRNYILAASKDPTIITPQTPLDLGVIGNGLSYYGLPTKNSDLGNHTITLQVNTSPTAPNWRDSEIAHIQTFFIPNDTTHPDPNGEGVTPN